jgi:hypothetical protein
LQSICDAILLVAFCTNILIQAATVFLFKCGENSPQVLKTCSAPYFHPFGEFSLHCVMDKKNINPAEQATVSAGKSIFLRKKMKDKK